MNPTASSELLQRVVNSQELKRAQRLRELMLYLGRRSIGDPTGSIREQEIGAAVFGRPEEYDTNIDNIVRVNVSELRKRLLHYFEHEGANEPIVIEIPRGGYLPVYLQRTVQTRDKIEAASNEVDLHHASLEIVAVAEASPAAEHALLRGVADRALWITGAVLVLVTVLCAFLAWQNRMLRAQLQPWKTDANRQIFWSQFFAAGQQVDIVTADTSYALAEDLLKRPISLDDYLDYKYRSFVDLPGVPAQTRDALNLVFDRNTGSVGDFEVAERIMALDAHSSVLKLASARYYTPQSIKNNNVILIGSRESNPWVELYKDRMNFVLEYDPAQLRSYVVNRAPIAGEQAVYETGQDKDREYSVVVFIPNLSVGRYTLIIAGTDSQGTRAAGEFITSSEGLAAIRERLPATHNPYFEVLLRSSRLEGTTLNTSIQAFRGYPH